MTTLPYIAVVLPCILASRLLRTVVMRTLAVLKMLSLVARDALTLATMVAGTTGENKGHRAVSFFKMRILWTKRTTVALGCTLVGRRVDMKGPVHPMNFHPRCQHNSCELCCPFDLSESIVYIMNRLVCGKLINYQQISTRTSDQHIYHGVQLQVSNKRRKNESRVRAQQNLKKLELTWQQVRVDGVDWPSDVVCVQLKGCVETPPEDNLVVCTVGVQGCLGNQRQSEVRQSVMSTGCSHQEFCECHPEVLRVLRVSPDVPRVLWVVSTSRPVLRELSKPW